MLTLFSWTSKSTWTVTESEYKYRVEDQVEQTHRPDRHNITLSSFLHFMGSRTHNLDRTSGIKIKLDT